MMRNLEKYTDEECYKYATSLIESVKIHGRIHTDSYGQENLPKTGGYVMFPNHQGKYDALGIISTHAAPCTIMMDEARSHMPLVNEMLTIIKGCRLDKTNNRKQVEAILDVTKQVKDGRRYIVFPEGGYEHNGNTLQEFLPGAFKCAIKAKAPIVPVALIDSYKPFGVNSLRKVTTQVHYLKPLTYEEYKEMSSAEIAAYVKDKIREVISSKTGQPA